MEGEMSQVPVPDEGVGTCDLHSLWQPHERLSHCTNWKPCGGTGKTTPASLDAPNGPEVISKSLDNKAARDAHTEAWVSTTVQWQIGAMRKARGWTQIKALEAERDQLRDNHAYTVKVIKTM